MTHSPPPGAPRARIPAPRKPPPPRPEPQLVFWRRCLWGWTTVWAITVLVTCVGDPARLPAALLLGGPVIPAALAVWAYGRRSRRR
ncbi:hypothetical protein [Streptomyces sp. NPDC006610]|uniref:hypothetical protein n=1 Tax=Streptomyces sp. NPDC006610 TaxID=3154584 RepID=UPI0033A1C38E